VVERSAHNLKIQGTSPTVGNGTGKIAKKEEVTHSAVVVASLKIKLTSPLLVTCGQCHKTLHL
jgi:hypothetical protein